MFVICFCCGLLWVLGGELWFLVDVVFVLVVVLVVVDIVFVVFVVF